MRNVRGLSLSLVVAGVMALVAGCGGDDAPAPTPDTTAPTVTDVTSTAADGAYPATAVIDVTVTFSEVVNVTGTPQLTLETGGTDAVVDYASGSGTATLTFTYTVAPGHTSADLDYVAATSLVDGGGTIQDAALNDAVLTLAAPGAVGSISDSKAIVIDTTVPTVTGVTSADPDGFYTIGGVIDIDVTFSEIVYVTGTPTLALNSGAPAVNYLSGDGTSVLTFRYTVDAGENSPDLDYVDTASLGVAAGSIQDAAANDAVLTLIAPGVAGSFSFFKSFVIDTTVPSIVNVTSTKSDGIYTVAEVIDIDVTFSESVYVTGTLTLALNSGVALNLYSGNGTDTFTFRYTVAENETSPDLDYVATNSLVLTGTIRDLALNDAVLTLAVPGDAGSLGNNKNIVIDAVAPTVTNVTSTTADGTYGIGATIDVTVTFDEAVTVSGGPPTLTLETGADDVAVDYVSGSGTDTLLFTYTVVAGHTSADLGYVGEWSFSFGGGSIQDVATNDASPTLPTLGDPGSLSFNKDIVVDGVVPTVTGVAATTPDGTYGIGAAIYITVTFSEVVTVDTTFGTPTLALNSSGGALAIYESGSPGTTLTFVNTVVPGDGAATLGYVNVNSLQLNGGTIEDAGANNANLTLFAPGAANSLAANAAIVIDTSKPSVLSVAASTVDGTYGLGAVIDVTVTFSESVTVTGTPTLTLENGSSNAVASHVVTAPGVTQTFRYTVAVGDTSGDLDYVATVSLALGAGTIMDTDTGTNAALLALPIPGVPGSLGANADIAIDGVVPVVSFVDNTTADGAYGLAAVIDVTVTFSESVTVTGTPTLTLQNGSSDAVASYVTGAAGTTHTFRYTVGAGDESTDLDYVATNSLALSGGTIRDVAANDATLTLASPAAANSLGANAAIVVDGVVPSVSSILLVGPHLDNAASVTYAITFSESVSGVDFFDLALTTTASASGSIEAPTTGDDIVYTVVVSGITGTGTLRLDVIDLGDIVDGIGNALSGARNGDDVQTVDRDVPAAPVIVTPTDGTVTDVDSVTISGTAEAGATVDVYIDGGYFMSAVAGGGVWSLGAQSIGNGVHSIRADATDLASNKGPLSSAVGITVDTTPPGLPGTPTDAGAVSGATVTFNWTAATDAESGIASYWLQVGSSPGGNNVLDTEVGDVLTYDINATGLDGSTLYARAGAQNGVGTWGAYSGDSDGILVDAQAPWVNWSQPNSGWSDVDLAEEIIVGFSEGMDVSTFAGGVHVYWDGANEPLHGYDMTWDGGTNQLTIICDTQDPAGLSNGDLLLADTTYTITIDATVTDVAGNPLQGGQYTESFTTRETTPPELMAMEVEDDGATVYDAMTEVVPEDAVEGGDTIDFYFSEAMDQTRARVEIRGPGDTRIEVGIRRVDVQTVTDLGGGWYCYETWGDHNLNNGDLVDIVNMIPTDYNVTNQAITWVSVSEFDINLGTPGYGPLTQNGSVLTYYDGNGSGCDVRWTAADRLTLTLGPDVSLVAGGEYEVRLNDVSDLAWNHADCEEVLQVMSDEVSGVGPTVLSTIPANAAVYDRNGPIIISFSEPVDKNTLSGITITSVPAGITIADFEVEYEAGDMDMTVLFIEPIQALPEGIAVTVTIPSTVADLAGNQMVADHIFTYTTDVETDTGGPTISMTTPADGETNAGGAWNPSIQIAFEDSGTGDPEVIDEASVDMTDFLVYCDTDSEVLRGWEPYLEGEDTIIQLRPTTWPGLEEGKTYTVDVGPNITDAAGNLMEYGQESFSFTMADFSSASENRTPVIDRLEIRLCGSTASSCRSLSINLRIRDDDDDLVTVTIDDSINHGGSVTIISDRLGDPDNWDWWTNEGAFRYGSDGGPPEGSDPAALDADTHYDSSGYYWFDITLDDGTNISTYSARAWIWATDIDASPDVIPELVTIGGVAPLPAEVILVTDSTPTVVWQDMDAANADMAMVVVADTSIIGDSGGTGYQFFVGLNPNDIEVTIPDDRPLDPSIYLTAVVEMKFSEGFGEEIGQGWSLDFGAMTMEPFFVYGPTNVNLWDDEHAVGRISITLDDDGNYAGCDNFSGTYTFGWDILSAPIDTAVAIAGEDAGGIAVLTQELYAYEAPELVITESSGGIPMPERGFTGRSEGLFTVARGANPSRAAITVGSTRAGALTDANELDGIWSLAQFEIADDGAGNYDGAGCSYGTVSLAAVTSTTGTATVSVTGQDGNPSGPPTPLAYTVVLATGEFVLDIGGDTVRGFVGGGANKNIMVLAKNTDADTPFYLVLTKQQVVAGVAQIAGDYNFTQIMIEQDMSGAPVLEAAVTMTGIVNFDGAGGWDATYQMSNGEAGTSGGTYSVNAYGGISMDDGSGMTTEIMIGPDFNTGIGIGVVPGDDSMVRLIIATKP